MFLLFLFSFRKFGRHQRCRYKVHMGFVPISIGGRNPRCGWGIPVVTKGLRSVFCWWFAGNYNGWERGKGIQLCIRIKLCIWNCSVSLIRLGNNNPKDSALFYMFGATMGLGDGHKQPDVLNNALKIPLVFSDGISPYQLDHIEN